MINKYFEGNIPLYNGHVTEYDELLEKETLEKIKNVEKLMDDYHISQALTEIWSIVSRTNKYIDETMPWVLAKEENKTKLESVMYHLVENLRKVAILIRPFMEETSNAIFRQLNISNEDLKGWNSLYQYDLIKESIKVIEKGEPLFVRLDANEEINYIKEGMKNG